MQIYLYHSCPLQDHVTDKALSLQLMSHDQIMHLGGTVDVCVCQSHPSTADLFTVSLGIFGPCFLIPSMLQEHEV